MSPVLDERDESLSLSHQCFSEDLYLLFQDHIVGLASASEISCPEQLSDRVGASASSAIPADDLSIDVRNT